MDETVAANTFTVRACQSLSRKMVEKHFLIQWGNTIKPACAQFFSRVGITSTNAMRAATAKTIARIELYNSVVGLSYRSLRL